MKIRNGFVSNSSSSSFIVLGIYTESEIESIELESGIMLDSLYIEGSPYENKDYVSGYIISDNDEGNDECVIENIPDIIKEIAKALNAEEKEVKLITGIRPS